MAIPFQPKYLFANLAISAAIAGIFAFFTDTSFWMLWPIAIVAMVINGYLAEWEDNQPGGFNNP